jgi:hypothetical protein
MKYSFYESKNKISIKIFLYFSIWSTKFTYIVTENDETSFVTNNFHETTDTEMVLLSRGSATNIFIHALEDFSVRSAVHSSVTIWRYSVCHASLSISRMAAPKSRALADDVNLRVYLHKRNVTNPVVKGLDLVTATALVHLLQATK